MRIKVCCISSPDEARIAIEAGAHALGLVSSMPSGPGPISDELIGEIARRVPPHSRFTTNKRQLHKGICFFEVVFVF